MKDQEAIRRLIDEVSEALQALDVEGILRHYAVDDPRFTAFEDHPPYDRLDGNRFREFAAALTSLEEIKAEKYDIRIDLFGHMAIATGYERWSIKGPEGADRGRTRFTLVLERKPEGWRVVHEHFTRLPEEG
jgi:ketosteroid isomerase-like protein